MARPIKLNAEIAESIIEGIQSGLYVAQIALDNNLHPETVRNWVQRGLQPDAEEPFASFARRFLQADVAVEKRTIRRILDAAKPRDRVVKKTSTTTSANGDVETQEIEQTETEPGDWRAAAFFAERRWPRRWAPVKEGQASGQDSISLPNLQEAAVSRPNDLDDLLSEPTPELEEAMLRNKDAILKLLGAAPTDE